MIRFNYEYIYLLAKGDSSTIVNYLKLIKAGSLQSLTGASYLVNPAVLYSNNTTRDIAEYVGLASYRDFNLFKATGDKRLLKSLIPPWVPDAVVLDNPLIEIDDKQHIIFILD